MDKTKNKFLLSFNPKILYLLILIFICSGIVKAGVLVAPTSVILSETDRTGRMTVQNPTDKPKEISVRFAFGIPTSDSLGNVTVDIVDSSETDNPRSAIGWVRAFPRKMVLAPGATQVVRFVANPPRDLPDGEYWARIVVRSQESQANIPVSGESDKITTQLNMVMETAIVLKYRTGDLIAKLDITDTEVKETDSLVSVTFDIANRGNTSYVGVLDCRLLDASNNELASRKLDFAIYEDLKRRIDLPLIHGLGPRPWHVEVSVSTEGRKDIPPEEMVNGNRIEFTKAVD